MMKRMLKNPKITVLLNTDFEKVRKKLRYKRLFWTGSIDSFFGYKKGVLPYRSLSFDIQEKNMPRFQEAPVVNYPNNYDFTRILEHKNLTGIPGSGKKTVISIEYPLSFSPGENERYYPISTPQNNRLYQTYAEMAKELENVYFLGRLGDYKYYNMDQAVARALDLFEQLFKENRK